MGTTGEGQQVSMLDTSREGSTPFELPVMMAATDSSNWKGSTTSVDYVHKNYVHQEIQCSGYIQNGYKGTEAWALSHLLASYPNPSL